MNIFKTLLIGAVGLGATAIATPAQAHDHHGHHWDRHGSWGHHYYYGHHYGYWGGPRYYGYYGGPYYYDYPGYSYYQPYYYGGGPSFTFAFGGHRGWSGHHWSHWHHR